MITGDSRKRKGYSGYEVTVNTSEAIDTGLGTSRSPKGKEAIEDIRNISVGRKYECKLCFSVMRNKLLFWQHLQGDSKEVPYKCKNYLNIFDDERTRKIHHRHRCCCAVRGKPIRGRSGDHAEGYRAGNRFTCSGCSKRFLSWDVCRDHLRSHIRGKSYLCRVCRKIFLTKYDAKRHKIHKNACLDPVKAFTSEVDLFKFDVPQCAENPSHVPDEERDEVMPVYSVNLRSEFNSSAQDSLSFVKEEPLCRGRKSVTDIAVTVDGQESNFTEKIDELDDFSCPLNDNHDKNKVECMKHMECHVYAQSAKCPELLSDKGKRDDYMKIHSYSVRREMVSTGQSQVPESSAGKNGDLMSGHANSLGERVPKICKLGRLHASEEKSVPVSSALIAPKTVGPPDLMMDEKGVAPHYIPNGNGVQQGTIAGGSKKPEGRSGSKITVNTSEALDAGWQTSKSPKGIEAVGDNGNKTSVIRQFECRLCLKVLRSKLLFWKHLHTHLKEVPYTCKNCVEIFEDENLWKFHHRNKCCCAACGKLILGSSASVHAKECRVGKHFTCSGCRRSFTSLDVYRDHLRSHIREKSYICRVCKKIFLTKADAERHKTHKNVNLNPVFTEFISEGELFVFMQSPENFPHVTDEERDKVMPVSSVNLDSQFNSSAVDSLPVVREESLCGGRKSVIDIAVTVGIQESNSYENTDEIDNFRCSLNDNHDESKIECMKHMECLTHAQCEICQELFCDKEKREDHMKSHSSSGDREMVSSGQSQVPKPSAEKDGDFMSGHADVLGETVSKKLKLGNIHTSEEKSVPVSTTSIAPKTGDPTALKDLIISEKGVHLHNTVPNVKVESEGMIAGGFTKSEITASTGEAFGTGLQTSKSPKGIVAMKDNSNISINRKYECTLCFSVLRNKLLFWQHLHGHSEEVPYICKQCVEIFDDEKTLKNHYKQRCCCAACGKLIRGRSGALHAKMCRIANPFKCPGCSERFPSSNMFRDHLKSHITEKSYICQMCRMMFLSKADAEQHKIHKHIGLNPVVTEFRSEVDFFKFDVIQDAEIRSHVPDEERDKVVPVSSGNRESEFNSSAVDSLSVVKEEPLDGGRKSMTDIAGTMDVQESNFIEKTDERTNFSCSLIDNHDGSKVECIEHMECHTRAQCEKCPELVYDKEKRDDLMKIHSSSVHREMVSTGRSKVPKSSSAKDRNFKSGHVDILGETVSKKWKLSRLHAREEEFVPVSSALIAPKTVGPPDLMIGEKGVALRNIPNGNGVIQETITGSSKKPNGHFGSEITVNTREAIGIGLQTLKSLKGMEAVADNGNKISVTRQFECRLCFSVLGNKLSFWEHLHTHLKEVPYTCKNCAKVFDDEKTWKIHNRHRCCCASCGKLLLGSSASVHAKECCVGKRFMCSGCFEVFPSSDIFANHLRSHIREKSYICRICKKIFLSKADAERHKVHKRKINSVMEFTGEVDMFLFMSDVTQNAENPSYVRDGERHEVLPVSSVNLKKSFDSSDLDPPLVGKEDPLYGGRKSVNDTAGTLDVQESNFIEKNGEIDDFSCSFNDNNERKVQCMEHMECHTYGQCEVGLELFCDKEKKDDLMKMHSSSRHREMVSTGQSQVRKSCTGKDGDFQSGHVDASGERVSKKLKLGHLHASEEKHVPVSSAVIAPNTVGPLRLEELIIGEKGVDLHNIPNGSCVSQAKIAGCCKKAKVYPESENIVKKDLLNGGIDVQESNFIINPNAVDNCCSSQCDNHNESRVERKEQMECHNYAQCEICQEVLCDEEHCLEMFCDKEKKDDHMKTHSSLCNEEMVLSGQSQVPNCSAVKDENFMSDRIDTSGGTTSKKGKLGHLQVSDGSCVQGTIAGGFEKAKVYPESENIVNNSEVHDTDLQTLNSQEGTETFNGIISVSRKHKCKLCFSVLKNKLLFWQHLRMHSEEVPYTCKNCVDIFDDENSWKIHNAQDCNCVVCGELIQGRYVSVHSKGCLIGNPFVCSCCDERFPSYDTLSDHMKSHSKDDSEQQKRNHRNKSLDSVVTVFPNEDEDESDFTGRAENPSSFPDEERVEVLPMSSVSLENKFNSSGVDSLSFVKKELSDGAIDERESNFTINPNAVDKFCSSLCDKCVESEDECSEHMECHADAQCEICQEMLCDKENCLEMFCDKEKKDDHMKTHSSLCSGEMVLSGQSQLPKSSAEKDGNFTSDRIDTSGDTTSKRVKLGHLQVSDGNSLIAPKTVGPSSLKDSVHGGKSVDLLNRSTVIDLLQGTVPGDEVMPMCSINHKSHSDFSSINHESHSDFSSLDSLSLVQEELLYGGTDLQGSNFITKTDDNNQVEKEVEYTELMECHADGECEICLEMFCNQEICLETICDKEKRDDHFKIHSSSCMREMVLTGQSQVPKSSAEKDGDFKSGHGDASGERVSKKLKLVHLHLREEKSVPVSSALIAPKTVGPQRLEEQMIGEKGVYLHNMPYGSRVFQEKIAVGCEKAKVYPESENIVNTSEVHDTDFHSLNSQEGTETVNGIISVSRKHECKLCFNVLKNKLLFWQHLRMHSEEVPYTCKNCVEIFDDENSWKIHNTQDCNCVVCGELIQGRYVSVHSKGCLIGNPFVCSCCDGRFPSYDTLSDHMKSHSKDDSEPQKRIHGIKSLDSAVTVFTNEDEDEADLLKVDVTGSAEDPSPFPDERVEVLAVSSVNLESDFNSSGVDSSSFVKKELSYGGTDVQEINFIINPNTVDNFCSSQFDKHVESEDECSEHMECHADSQCEICQEMLCDKEHCLEMFYDKEKRDDYFKIHSSSCKREMVLTAQSQVPKSSAEKDGDLMRGHADNFEETISKKLKSEHLHVSEENSVPVNTTLLSPKSVGSLSLKDLDLDVEDIDLHNVQNGFDVIQGTIAGGSEIKPRFSSETTVNTSEADDTGFQTANYQKGRETVKDIGSNISVSRKYECKLCFSVLKNKLLFWEHLHGHSEEVPYTCKNCAEIFDDEKSWKIHNSHKCNCAFCGKLIQGSYTSFHHKSCIGNSGCAKRLPSFEFFSVCRVCGEIFIFNDGAEHHKSIHGNNNLDPVATIFLSEVEDVDDLLEFDVTESGENSSNVPDEETYEIMPMTSVRFEIDYNPSVQDSLSIVEEPLYGGIDDEESNFSLKPNDIDNFNCSLYNNHVESKVDCIEHMECHTCAQCEICQEMLCDKEHCLEMFCDKEKKDDHMKIHSSPCIGEMVLTGQSQDQKSSAVIDGDFMSDHTDTFGETTNEKLKLGHLHISEGNSLIAPKTVGPPSLKDIILGEKSGDMHNIPNVIGFLQRTVTGGSERIKAHSGSEKIMNTSEILDTDLQTFKSDRGSGRGQGNDNDIFTTRKYECNLCFSMLRNKLLFWQHLNTHFGQVPYTCKNCSEIFDDEESLETHNSHKCNCAACGKLLQGIYASIHFKHCHIGNPLMCICCSKRFPSSDVFRDHVKCHFRDKSFTCKLLGKVCVSTEDAEHYKKSFRNRSFIPVATRSPSEDGEDDDLFLFLVTQNFESPSHVPNEQCYENMPVYSFNLESCFDFSSLDILSDDREEPLYEGIKLMNDIAGKHVE